MRAWAFHLGRPLGDRQLDLLEELERRERRNGDAEN
jgi:hypothetical protein